MLRFASKVPYYLKPFHAPSPPPLSHQIQSDQFSMSNSATIKPESDWSHLPPELLQAISDKVAIIGDYIRFRAVCHPWRSASSPQPQHLPVQAPWLMLPYQSKGKNADYTRLFYDLSTSKIHRLHLRETKEVQICGSSHGWLVLHDGKVTSLLNPITRTTIALPPHAGPPARLGIDPLENDLFENLGSDRYTIYPNCTFSVKKAMLSSSPLNPNCLVFVLIDALYCLAFCKIGDDRWTVIESGYNSFFNWELLDFTYSNGSLYTVDNLGKVTIYNINSLTKTVVLGHSFGRILGINRFYIVEGVSGDLLLIGKGNSGWGFGAANFEKEINHTVYKLSTIEKQGWIKVADLGQDMLFVGGNDHAISLSSANLELPKWCANCLFYDSIFSERWNRDESSISYNHNVKRNKLDDGTVTAITGDLGPFFESQHRQKSLWLTPSFL